jgi:hypothetical protein
MVSMAEDKYFAQLMQVFRRLTFSFIANLRRNLYRGGIAEETLEVSTLSLALPNAIL